MTEIYDSAAWTGRRYVNPHNSEWAENVSEAIWEISPWLCRLVPVSWVNYIGDYIEGCVDCHNELRSYGHAEANCSIRRMEIEDAKRPLQSTIRERDQDLAHKDEVIENLRWRIRDLERRLAA